MLERGMTIRSFLIPRNRPLLAVVLWRIPCTITRWRDSATCQYMFYGLIEHWLLASGPCEFWLPFFGWLGVVNIGAYPISQIPNRSNRLCSSRFLEKGRRSNSIGSAFLSLANNIRIAAIQVRNHPFNATENRDAPPQVAFAPRLIVISPLATSPVGASINAQFNIDRLSLFNPQ